MNESSEQFRLQQALRESRTGISREYMGLLRELDLRRRFTESVRKHPLGWIGGAAAAGLVTVLFGIGGPRRKSAAPGPLATPPPSSLGRIGWAATALEIGRLLYPVLRPVVADLLTQIARTGVARKEHLR